MQYIWEPFYEAIYTATTSLFMTLKYFFNDIDSWLLRGCEQKSINLNCRTVFYDKINYRRLFFIGWRKRASLSEGKKNIIAAFINEYDIQSTENIQEAQLKRW